MKFVNFSLPEMPGRVEAGLLVADAVVPLKPLLGWPIPLPIAADASRNTLAQLPKIIEEIRALPGERFARAPALDAGRVVYAPPLLSPPTFRDFYAFEAHVKTARAKRGLEMVPDWYELPVFYFSNPHAFYGHGATVPVPTCGEWVDYELEIAAVIGVECRNVRADEAEQFVAGYTILNDWSERSIQRREMAVGLGPAKAKDFASGLGPALVTPDELSAFRAGKGYDLTMVARVNGRELSRGNWKDLHFSFGEMIARASADVTLRPGDVIGSGTVGTGCILEIGTEASGGWLKPGDVVELEVERLGVLRQTVGAR